MTRFFLILLILMSFLGCTVNFPQLTSAVGRTRDLLGAFNGNAETPASDRVWLASVDGAGAVLLPYTSDKLTVFANADGIAVSFDGWIPRSILGFERFGTVTIAKTDGGWIARTTKGEEVLSICAPWVFEKLEGAGRWTLKCNIGGAEIDLNNEQEIQRIWFDLGKKLGSLELTLNN